MKEYFVIADTHSYFTKTITALKNAGFDQDNPNHIIIHCGDMCDRGKESWEIVEWAYDLMNKERFIFVRGNHEDLFQEMLVKGYSSRDEHNGTLKTLAQLQYKKYQTESKAKREFEWFKHHYNKHWDELMFNAVDFYETPHYIFVHGWIPTNIVNAAMGFVTEITPLKDWRNKWNDWDDARWTNGIKAARLGGIVPDKTIVCGHWSTYYGHALDALDRGVSQTEIEKEVNACNPEYFKPYYGKGIIAIDGTTALTGIVNVLHFTEEEL